MDQKLVRQSLISVGGSTVISSGILKYLTRY